jgi:outer membrane lipoprotein-sorting protein
MSFLSRSSCLLLLQMVFLISCLAATDDLEARFLGNQKKIKTLQADFQQTILFPGMRSPVVSLGRFYYQAPDKIRINYTSPAGDYFLLSGDLFETRRNRKPPVVQDSKHPSAGALTALRKVLLGTPPGGEFQKTVERSGDEFTVTLQPLVPKPSLPRKIVNRVDARSLELLGMEISLPQGGTMKFEFQNIDINQRIGADVFSAGD